MNKLFGNDQTGMTFSEESLASDTSRKAFLTKIMAGAAAATTLAVAPASVFAASGQMSHVGAGLPASDAAILNFALTLEHLEARFYQEAANRFKGNSYMSQVIRTLRFDEESHVNGLTAAIKGAGYKPVGAAMSYKFGNVMANKKSFLTFAAKLEDTGVHAYLGQAPNIKTPAILLTAASIVTVEARHAGAIRSFLHQNPTDGPFDKGLTKTQILGMVGPLVG